MLLSRLLDLEKTPAALRYGEEYNLEKFRTFVDSLGAPQRGLTFIHIAGTKGKGSTAAICEGLLRGLGFPTALFSSPHLHQFGERYRFDGKPWTLAEFEAALQRFYDALGPEQRHGFDSPHPYRTVFETLTAVALVEFRAQQMRLRERGVTRPLIVLWETGLGGRLDCTNIVDPAVSVITTLAMDHTKILGDTIEAIAGEKAGIIKRGRPAVVSRQAPEFAHRVWPVLMEKAAREGAPLVRAWEHNPVLASVPTAGGQHLRVRLPDGREAEAELTLRGSFQVGNFEAALAAVWYVLKEQKVPPGSVDLLAGLPLVNWPGRLELHRGAGGRVLLLDGAHCPYSAKALGQGVRQLPEDVLPLALLFSMQKDKDARGFLQALSSEIGPGGIASVYTYPLPGPRGSDAAELAEHAVAVGLNAVPCNSPEEAYEHATSTHPHVLAAGTLYTLHDFAERWRGRVGR